MPDKFDLVYSAIGALLTEDDLKQLLKRSAGIELSDIVGERETPKKKVEKVIEYLKARGNERWLLTRVLSYAPAEDQVRKKIIDAFPATLIGLPAADNYVRRAIGFLQKLLSLPLSADLKYKLLPTRRSFAKMPQSFVVLFALKDLQQLFLRLLFTLSANEAILAHDVDGLAPDLEGIANQIDQVVLQSAAPLARLGSAAPLSDDLAQLTRFAVSLRSAPIENAADLIGDVQRMVRKSLSRMNGDIFRAAQDLSFDALTDDLPLRIDAIQNRQEYRELVQQIRDVAATVLARALKNKLWQDAENDISLIRSYFILPQDSIDVADDWFSVRDRVDWLAQLEPEEQWAKEARKYAVEIEDELFQEKKLDDNVRLHFMAYCSWFRGPFLKIDDTTKTDFGSLNEFDGPFSNILKDLEQNP